MQKGKFFKKKKKLTAQLRPEVRLCICPQKECCRQVSQSWAEAENRLWAELSVMGDFEAEEGPGCICTGKRNQASECHRKTMEETEVEEWQARLQS